jgi:hypothetical protein
MVSDNGQPFPFGFKARERTCSKKVGLATHLAAIGCAWWRWQSAQ